MARRSIVLRALPFLPRIVCPDGIIPGSASASAPVPVPSTLLIVYMIIITVFTTDLINPAQNKCKVSGGVA